MKRQTQAILAGGVLAALLSGCAEMPSNAPVDDRTAPKQFKKQSESTPVVDPPGYYTVRKGDTLSRIAYQFGQAWRDLVDWNSLANPNDIKVGQQLRVAPPEGARMASVPDSGMEVRALDSNPSPASSSASSVPRVPGALKSGPLGSKVPYSDQALAELQRAEASPPRVQEVKKTDAAPVTPPPSVRFIWPTEGKLLNGFDAARKGIDIAGQLGQPVVSVGDGTVLYAKNMRGYGNLVIIDHQEGVVSAYAHNKTIMVTEGQTVSRGQQIAEMGNTDADAVKLHFEIRQLGKPVDPTGFLPGR
jgi:lipoprotein NlpD